MSHNVSHTSLASNFTPFTCTIWHVFPTQIWISCSCRQINCQLPLSVWIDLEWRCRPVMDMQLDKTFQAQLYKTTPSNSISMTEIMCLWGNFTLVHASVSPDGCCAVTSSSASAHVLSLGTAETENQQPLHASNVSNTIILFECKSPLHSNMVVHPAVGFSHS